MPDYPAIEPPAIVVTASRSDERIDQSPASVTLIEAAKIERLGSPQVTDFLRLVPSAAVSVSGPTGSLSQVRIRGAEANHTLLFVEGISANDPAAGNEPRFELLNADIASRIEVVRGPQSALWGSEAIGGVIAVDGPAPGDARTRASIEAGSFDTRRGAARTSFGNADSGASIGIAGQRSDGIDSFGDGRGERDGYHNVALRGAAKHRLSPVVSVGLSGFATWGRSEFDGYDPITFARADTLDESRNRLAAARVFADLGNRQDAYLRVSTSALASSNRNLVDDAAVNRTSASRKVATLEAGKTVGKHSFVAALEGEGERFRSRDQVYGGATDQDRSRRHNSLTIEWRGRHLGPLSAGVVVRHDIFSRFKDATSIRGSVLAQLGSGFALSASYGEGIAQPTFFDLYGFFPGSFVGNDSIKPEQSRGGEIGFRYANGPLSASATYYRQRLSDEIVDVFDPVTFLSSVANADGKSKRQGVELQADYRPATSFGLLATYAWLDASEPTGPAGVQVKEQRRAKHSGSVSADGEVGRLRYGAAVAYTGSRRDTDFDLFPAQRVRLGSYWLANARIGYRVTPSFEAHVRIANAFDSKYRDVVGYRVEGRSIHAGLSVALDR
ncbi:TonB-dependent receptor plug domain-containing protein [Sphingomonas sp. LY160]|uniref:TonB-dependent receptor plug domain-containing protein n=1 Tax=Sphingomonas sp. LY160 TaxID=3095342 RepID=UPI002ADECFA6|nr:TonB-dependent receptor [Sphingomonas sp. LY160]MEA1071137.1 TonB-dependent receptor [Sphingomonas sp. LY160]